MTLHACVWACVFERQHTYRVHDEYFSKDASPSLKPETSLTSDLKVRHCFYGGESMDHIP